LLLQKSPIKTLFYELYTEYTNEIIKKLDSIDRHNSDSVFTLSFSEQTDLLSQWRGYCPNNNGYCIVFDVDSLFQLAKSSFDNCHFVKCVYDIEQKQSQLKKLLNGYWFKYTKLNTKDKKNVLLEELTREVMLLASYFKDPTFEEEKEHRIVILLEYATDNDLKFREGRYSLIPYLELKALRKAVKKVIIGPTADKNLAKRALELLWEKCYGMPSILVGMDIEFSKTPFRSW
jgi:Protein of unknown function (DUF2971)